MGRVLRWLPPAPSLPDHDSVCTDRHACNPPRAWTFFDTISAAERLVRAEGVSAASAIEKTVKPSSLAWTAYRLHLVFDRLLNHADQHPGKLARITLA